MTQSFNRYSYARNNPLKYIDPSGYFDIEEALDYLGELLGFDEEKSKNGDWEETQHSFLGYNYKTEHKNSLTGETFTLNH